MSSKASVIIGLIGQFAPQILAFTKFSAIAPSVSQAMQTAEGFIQQPGQSQADFNAQRLNAVLAEATTAATAVNAQAGKTVIDPTEISAVGTGIINQTIATINLVHDIHTNATTGNPAAVPVAMAPATPAAPTTTSAPAGS